jgi:hypothetical protein
MSGKRIGYFEGTDSSLLTALICDGHVTLPVSNGRDHHGRTVRLINDKDRVDLLIAYVHKIVGPDGEDREKNDVTFQELFQICRIYEIPLLLETPTALQPKAVALLGGPPGIVQLVDPADALEVARRILAGA